MFLHIDCGYCCDLVKNGADNLSSPSGEMEGKSVPPHTGWGQTTSYRSHCSSR